MSWVAKGGPGLIPLFYISLEASRMGTLTLTEVNYKNMDERLPSWSWG